MAYLKKYNYMIFFFTKCDSSSYLTYKKYSKIIEKLIIYEICYIFGTF